MLAFAYVCPERSWEDALKNATGNYLLGMALVDR